MACTDATGAATPLGICKYNTSADAPSGLGLNAIVDQLDALLQARVVKPSGIAAGEVPVWNGSGWDRSSVTKIANSSLAGYPFGGGLIGVQVFTANGTYTPTSGTTKIIVEAQAGGGAGGGASSSAAGGNGVAGGSGGGGGGYARKLLTSGFSGAAVVVGAGGTGVVAGTGNTGGDSTFGGTLVVAKGGTGGQAASNFAIGAGNLQASYIGGGSGQVAGGVGDFLVPGGSGSVRLMGVPSAGSSAEGGHSFLGRGGIETTAGGGIVNAGNPGSSWGGGGGGAVGASTASTAAGGAGGQGIVIILEFA